MMLTVAVQGVRKRLQKCRYRLAVAIVACAAALRLFLEARYGVTPPYITFYPATMLAAVLGGAGPGFLATMASAAFVAVFLLAPRGQIAIAHPSDLVALGVFVLMGLL